MPMEEETGFVLSKRIEDVIHWASIGEVVSYIDTHELQMVLWLLTSLESDELVLSITIGWG